MAIVSSGVTTQIGLPDDLQITPVTIATPAHPDSQRLLAYWQECAQRGGLKLGRDLPTRTIASLISKLSVLESVDGGEDFVFRIAGSSWLKRFGRDVQRERLSHLYSGALLSHYLAHLRAVLETGKPKFVDVHVRNGVTEVHHIEYALLPAVASNDESLCVLIGAFHFEART